MTAETEVSKEVVGIGEKCGPDLSSSQDPPSSGCNGKGDHGGDPDNSYVFVTGSDGLSDDSVECKEEDVVAVAGEVDGVVQVQDREFNVLNGDVSQSVEEVNIGDVEGNGVSLVGNGVGIGSEEETTPEGGEGVVVDVVGIGSEEETTPEGGEGVVVDVPEEKNVGVESGVVPEVNELAEDSNGSVESVAGADLENAVEDHSEKLENVTECEIKQVEDPNLGLKSSEVTEVDEVTDQNVILESVEVNEVVLAEDPEMLESSTIAEMKNVDHINESLQDESKSEIEDSNETLENLEGSESEVAADPTADVTEDEIKQVEDPEKKLESSEGSESEVVADANLDAAVDAAEDEIKQVDEPELKLENSEGSELEMVSDPSINVAGDEIKQFEDITEQTKIFECATENETKRANDADLKPENSAGAVPEQKTEGVTVSESPKLVNQTAAEASPAVIENLESQVWSWRSIPVADPSCSFTESFLGIAGSSNDNGKSNDQNELESTRISELCQRSQGVVEDPVESKLQEVASEGKKEILLAEELVETCSGEVPRATSMDTDIEPHLLNGNEGTLEEQEKAASVSDVTGNQTHEIIPPSIQGGQVNEAQSVVANDESPVDTVCEVLEKTCEEDIPVPHGEFIAQNDKDPEKQSDTFGIPSEMTKSGTETEPSQSLPASCPQGEIGMLNAEIAEESSLAPIDGAELQIVETGPTDHERLPINTKNDDASSVSASVPVSVVSAETEPVPVIEAEESTVIPEVLSDQPAAADVKLDSEVHGSGETSNVGKVIDVAAGLDVKKHDSNTALDTNNVEVVGDQLESLRSSNNENLLLQEKKGAQTSDGDGISVASPDCSRTDTISGEEIAIRVVTKPFNYVMKVPRFNDDGLKEQIRQAKLKVEEKTKVRDAIQRQIQQIRANGQIHGVDYEYAKGENRNARKLVRLKRMEIDSLQSVISKAKNAISIGDIDARIQNVEHMIQHETLPLKEEKQLIREIKQLRGLRGELSLNMGTEEEIKQALEQREEAEERLKSLRKELELLKGEVLKAEAATMEAGTKYDNEIRKVRELQVQFKAANDVRQEAYVKWLSLRKELSEKNKHFFKYRDDAATASNYAFSRDTESLYRLCTDQVKNFMELWNTNDKFRKEYISFNTRSTVRRFGTLDGRSLGPDEEPIVLPNYVDERVHRVVSAPPKVDLVSQTPLEPKLEATVEKETVAYLSPKKMMENKNLTVKNKKAAEPVIANGLATVNSLDAPDEVQEEPTKSKEEIELDRKAEELRKKEAEAKLKEERRLEGLAKANEARERKKRQAEKIQLRAELKARKEAEEKEKEREKRLRKKERKKAGDSNDGNNNSDSAPSTETAVEAVRQIDAKDTTTVVPKKPQKYLKLNKTKSSIPPPLRNRNRKKWQQYAYVTAAGLLVLVLFWVGNIGLFANKTMKRPNPFY